MARRHARDNDERRERVIAVLDEAARCGSILRAIDAVDENDPTVIKWATHVVESASNAEMRKVIGARSYNECLAACAADLRDNPQEVDTMGGMVVIDSDATRDARAKRISKRRRSP